MLPTSCRYFVLLFSVVATFIFAAEPTFTRQRDIIYHRQDGYVLTLERVTPAKQNGAAVIMVMSGGWFSSHAFTRPHAKNQIPGVFRAQATQLLENGYTLFYVVHGTQPKFTIREIHPQISAAVRFIRREAKKFKIDSNRIGIMGGSAGGHLSLLQATKGEAANAKANAAAAISSKVQAAVAYFPPTDFLNYGGDGVFFDKVVREVTRGRNPYLQALDFVEFDAKNIRRNKVTDKERLNQHYKFISPAYHVTKDDAPTLILHGDVDKLVPLQQAQLIAQNFEAKGVAHRLFVKKGGNHGWPATKDEATMIADWFNKHLGAASKDKK